jgi:alpha-ketoglutarate-dependent taurine dioxygenase
MTNAQPTLTPLEGTLGASITNIDLSALTDDTWALVDRAFLEHGLLVFPEQHLSEDDQVAFAKRFGPIEHLTPNKALVHAHLRQGIDAHRTGCTTAGRTN